MDNSRYDCQIITPDGDELNLLYYDKAQPQNQLLPLRAVRQDAGNNPWETRPESGDIFSQGDFSGGQGQTKFHAPNRDETQYLWSEGFDLTEPGVLKHLHPLDSVTTGYLGPFTIANGSLFCIKASVGTDVGMTSDLTTFADEEAHPTGTVVTMCSSGNDLYVSINDTLVGSVRKRDSAGTWTTSWGPSGTAVPTVMVWAFDRIMFYGNQRIYELVPGGTEVEVDVFPSGQSVRSMWVAGSYLYAAVVDSGSKKSAIRHYGLNSDATAIEAKGYTEMPNGIEVWNGLGYVGNILLAGAKEDTANTVAPVLLQAFPSADGHLQWAIVAEGKNGMTSTSPQLRVDSMAVIDNRVVMAWDTGTSDELTGQKQGTAFYNLATGAFHLGHDLSSTVATVAHYTTKFAGRIVHDKGVNIHKENLGKYEPTATLISSVADWNNAGTKLWQTFDISYASPLPDTASVSIYYTTQDPREADWTLVGTDSTAGSLGKRWTPAEPINSRMLAVKLVSAATTAGTSAPEIQSFSVRSDPTVDTADVEWQLSRVVRLLPRDRKSPQAQAFTMRPDEVRTELMNLAHQSFTFKEGPDAWTVRLVPPAGDFKPYQTAGDTTTGEPSPKDGYLFQLTLEGTKT